MAEPASIVIGSIGITIACGIVIADKVGIGLNNIVYDLVDKEFILRPNSGIVQRKLPRLRDANARYGFPAPLPAPVETPDEKEEEREPGEVDSDEEEDEKQPMRLRPYSEEMWMQSPHIRAICEYARNRPGFLSYYWCRRFVLLHYIFMEWMATIPADSYIRTEGCYVPAFVELHLHHFECGPRGRWNNRFKF